MERSEFLDKLIEHLPKPQHTILIGARQVGKTTLVKQLANYLESQKQSVYFLTLEDPSILIAINEHPENVFNFTKLPSADPSSKLFIIIDEVQYAANPSNFLKLIYDKYAGQVKIIATGSSAFYIDKNFKDSLAGRKRVFELYPLSFDEFLHFKEEELLRSELEQMKLRKEYISQHRLKINILFDEYLIFGGYPAVALASDFSEKRELLKELVNSYMKKDALEAGIREDLKFFQLARLLSDQVGSLVNQNELGNTLKLASGTVDNYLYLLQKSFIIQLIAPMFGNVRKELTKMPKVYFNDNGLRNALLNDFSDMNDRRDKGHLLENYIYTKLRYNNGNDALHYWRTADGNEVDFIVEHNFNNGLAYEVKYNDSSFSASKYQKFIQAYPNFPLTVIAKEIHKKESIEAIRL